MNKRISRENDHAQRKLNIWTGNLGGFAEATQHDANNHGATLTRYIYATRDANIYIWVKSVALKKSFRDALGLTLILNEDEAFIVHPSKPPKTSDASHIERRRTPGDYGLKDSHWPSN